LVLRCVSRLQTWYNRPSFHSIQALDASGTSLCSPKYIFLRTGFHMMTSLPHNRRASGHLQLRAKCISPTSLQWDTQYNPPSQEKWHKSKHELKKKFWKKTLIVSVLSGRRQVDMCISVH
jgi:hypothetical protein